MEVPLTLLCDRFDDGVSRTDLARVFINLGGDTKGGGGGLDWEWVGGSDSFFISAPATTNSINIINDTNNGAVKYGGWRRSAARLSALLSDLLRTKDIGSCLTYSSDHKNDTNDGDGNEETAR